MVPEEPPLKEEVPEQPIKVFLEAGHYKTLRFDGTTTAKVSASALVIACLTCMGIR